MVWKHYSHMQHCKFESWAQIAGRLKLRVKPWTRSQTPMYGLTQSQVVRVDSLIPFFVCWSSGFNRLKNVRRPQCALMYWHYTHVRSPQTWSWSGFGSGSGLKIRLAISHCNSYLSPMLPDTTQGSSLTHTHNARRFPHPNSYNSKKKILARNIMQALLNELK
jgi:hypothetical protein